MSKQRDNRLTTQQQVVMQRVHQGPLPAPEDLARYNDIEPGIAHRIVCMAEQQAEHRQRLETIAVSSGAWNSKWGLIAAWSLGMASIVGGAWIISIGKSAEGLSLIIGSLGSLVGVFLYGKRSTQKELEKKRNG